MHIYVSIKRCPIKKAPDQVHGLKYYSSLCDRNPIEKWIMHGIAVGVQIDVRHAKGIYVCSLLQFQCPNDS